MGDKKPSNESKRSSSTFRRISKTEPAQGKSDLSTKERLQQDLKLIAQYEGEDNTDKNLIVSTNEPIQQSRMNSESDSKKKIKKKGDNKKEIESKNLVLPHSKPNSVEEKEIYVDNVTVTSKKNEDESQISEHQDAYQNVFQTLHQKKPNHYSNRNSHSEEDEMPRYRDSGQRKLYVFDLATVVKYDKPKIIKPPKPGAIPTLIVDPVEEALTQIFPPRCWKHKNRMYRQCVSKMQASDQDNVELLETLLLRVKEASAEREKWCPLRYNIYIDCFNEVIRQITINCPERGLLVARMRDEIDLSLNSFSTLVCCAANFGNRKSIQLREEIGHLEGLIESSQIVKNRLDEIIDELILANAEIDLLLAEERAMLEKSYARELNFHRKMSVQLKTLMEQLTSQ